MKGLKIGRRINPHHVGQLLKKDFKDVFTKNPIVVLTLIAIIILPSLYALINIQACWDPYENTGNLEIAVANLDNGSTYNGEKINVGEELEDDLKRNDDFYWVIVSEDELREGVENGTYYSGIIVPKNFTESIISITTDDPHSAELEYLVNRKTNPMASKLSDSAAKAVYNKVNSKIVQFIDLAAYSKLGELQSKLAQGASQMSAGAGQLSAGASKVSSGKSKVESGASQVKSGAKDLKKGASKLESGSSKVSAGASKVKDGANKVNEGSKKVKDGASQVSSGSSQVSSSADEISQGSAQVQQSAQQLDSSVDESQLPEQVQPVVHGSKELANASSTLAGSSSQLAQGSSKLANSSVQLADGASGVAGGASGLADGASGVADGASALANGSSKLANGASQLANGTNQLADGSVSLAAGSAALANGASSALFGASSALSGASSSLSGVTGVDEDQIGDYFYSPVVLKENELNEIPNYGSEISPFYIVLSMWVGAVITCVMLRTGQSAGTKFTPSEMYFGKLLIFLVMAILETTVTLIGAYVLGIKILNPVLFTLSAYFVALVFMIIVYSLSSALGIIGKGLAVIWLVFQISGTGGIYPIQLVGPILQTLYPYMPMTHGINLLRESALGLLWSNYIPSFCILIVIAVVTLILALFIKMFADKRALWFESKLNETDLF